MRRLIFALGALLVLIVPALSESLEYKVKDVSGVLEKEITIYNNLSATTIKNIGVEKTINKGDVDIELYYVDYEEKEVIDNTYDCNCKESKSIIVNGSKTSETSLVCETCTESHFEKVKVYKKLSEFKKSESIKDLQIIEKVTPLKIEEIEGVGWGYRVYSNITILDNEIINASWWNETYYNRRTLTINSSENRSLFEYRIYLNTTEWFDSGNYLSDCNDTVFAYTNGTIIPHFTQRCVTNNNGTTSIFDILLFLPEGLSNIDVYYNNPSANNLSSASDVFGDYLQMYAPFNNNPNDILGNESATNNGADIIYDRDGYLNASYNFVRTNGDYINYTHTYSNIFSWCFSVNNTQEDYDHRFLNYDDAGSNRCGYITYARSGHATIPNKYYIVIKDSVGTWHINTQLNVGSGNYELFCISHNSTNIDVYLNSTLQAITFSNGEAFNYINNPNCPFEYGIRSSDSNSPHNGQLDELRVYNGLYLDEDYIKRFYMNIYPTYIIGVEQTYSAPFILNTNKISFLYPTRNFLYPTRNFLYPICEFILP